MPKFSNSSVHIKKSQLKRVQYQFTPSVNNPINQSSASNRLNRRYRLNPIIAPVNYWNMKIAWKYTKHGEEKAKIQIQQINWTYINNVFSDIASKWNVNHVLFQNMDPQNALKLLEKYGEFDKNTVVLISLIDLFDYEQYVEFLFHKEIIEKSLRTVSYNKKLVRISKARLT